MRAISIVLGSVILFAACAKKEAELPIAVWESAVDSRYHVRLELYPKKSFIRYEHIEIDAFTAVRGDQLIWLVEPDKHGVPVSEVPFAQIQKDGSLLVRIVPSLADDSRLAPYHLKKEPNQSSQRNAMARPISVFESRSSRG